MKFFKEIGLKVLFPDGRFICRNRFELGVSVSQILIEQCTVLRKFIYVFHTNAFVKQNVPAQLYGVEKRIWKEQGYKTDSKEDKNRFLTHQIITKYCYRQ